jgi:eukaryotic-like serine/threonine-protein kinase
MNGRTRTDSVAGRVWGRLAGMAPLSTGLPLAERYLLIEQLGSGGMSVVWRGFDDVLGRPVAVKVLSTPTAADPAFRAAIRKEARATARLSHPHITQVYDYGEAALPDGPTVSYVVMELLSGQTIGQRLTAGPLPWREAVQIAGQVAQALAAAHRRGVVHRDIAPANVMLTATGAKVLDFGIAALAGGRGDPDGGGLLGTPAYVAPERLDDAPAAPAADVYALGALLYEMLTGAPPVPAKTWPALVEAYRDAPVIAPLAIPELPETVAGMVARCLAADPAARPGTAEVAEALVAAGATPTPPPAAALRAATRETPAVLPGMNATHLLPRIEEEPPPPTMRVGRLALIIAIATVLVLIAAALIVAITRDPHHPSAAATTPLAGVGAGPTWAPSVSVSSATPTPTAAASRAPAAGPGPSASASAPVAPLSVVDEMITAVQHGGDEGQIRPDVAIDFENVLHQLRGQILAGQPVDYARWTSDLRTKISQRMGEHAITDSVGLQLLSFVDQLPHNGG